jgi:glucose dehydrogenase
MTLRLCSFAFPGASVLVSGSGASPEAQDWTTVNKDYSSQRYVDLEQITPKNVGGLKEFCEFQREGAGPKWPGVRTQVAND